jgi:hypothetical protein
MPACDLQVDIQLTLHSHEPDSTVHQFIKRLQYIRSFKDDLVFYFILFYIIYYHFIFHYVCFKLFFCIFKISLTVLIFLFTFLLLIYLYCHCYLLLYFVIKLLSFHVGHILFSKEHRRTDDHTNMRAAVQCKDDINMGIIVAGIVV